MIHLRGMPGAIRHLSLFIGLCLFVLLPVLAQETKKEEKPKPEKEKFQPLIIRGEQGGDVTVPQQEFPEEKDHEAELPSSSSVGASSSGIFIPRDLKQKDKKQDLWIYTLPKEQELEKEKLKEADRQFEEWERIQRENKLPEGVGQPEYQKSILPPDPKENLFGYPMGDKPVQKHEDLYSEKQRLATEKSDSFLPPIPSAFDKPQKETLPGVDFKEKGMGTQDKTDSYGGFLYKPEDQKERDTGFGKAGPDYNSLYQTNEKKKKIEDYYEGLNKPTEREKAEDRYHKPQKPQ